VATRIVSFAGCSVAIEYPGSDFQQLVDLLFRDVGSDTGAAPRVTLRIERDPAYPNYLHLLCEGETCYAGDSPGALADVLLSETIHHLTDKNSRGMALHAGALSYNGIGIVLPGVSGAGKSTLTAWLARRGYNCLSDELIFIEKDSLIVEGFPRPVSIKAYGLAALEDEVDFAADANDMLVGPYATWIPHRLLNPNGQHETPVLGAVLFPNHREGSDFELIRLAKGETGLALMQCLLNARNLEGHGFGEAARIARDVPAYRLTYSDFSQLSGFMDAILDV
jgi:hypothetical protein